MNCQKSAPKLELQCSKLYAVTLNPNNDSQAFDLRFTPEARWNKVTQKFIDQLSVMESFDYQIQFECSTPDHLNATTKTRIHAHGFITILDMPRFLLTEINRLAEWCDIKIKEVTQENGYLAYMCKQEHVWAEAGYTFFFSSEIVRKKAEAKKKAERDLLIKSFNLKYPK